MEVLEIFFWSALVSGIWFGAFIQNRQKKRELDDIMRYKYYGK